MIFDNKGKPLLGHVSSGVGLVGYLNQEGSSFAAELASAINQVESYCSRKKIPIVDLGFTGELDFLVKELGVVKERWIYPETGSVFSLYWYNLVMASGLAKAALDKLEEMTITHDPAAGANPDVFNGMSSQQVVDAIAIDCRTGTDAFSHIVPEVLLECISECRNMTEETQKFVTINQVEMLQLEGEEDRIFRRYCYSFSWKSKVVISNDEMDVVADLARRAAEDFGSFTVTTYSFESVHGTFNIISQRTELISENYDETEFYGPFCIRNGTYGGLPTKRVVEVL